MVPFEVLAKFRLERIEIADHADDHRLILDDHQHPEIILDPRARFHFDTANNTQRYRRLAEVAREKWRRIWRPWIGRYLRSRLVIEMKMRIDNRNGADLGSAKICRRHGSCRRKK